VGGASAVRIFAARQVDLFASGPLLSALIGGDRASSRLALFAALGVERFGRPGGRGLPRDRADDAERRAFRATTLEGHLNAAQTCDGFMIVFPLVRWGNGGSLALQKGWDRALEEGPRGVGLGRLGLLGLARFLATLALTIGRAGFSFG